MKTKSLFPGLITLGILMTSCDHETIRAQGEATTTEVYFSDYSGLRVSNAFNVLSPFPIPRKK